MHPCFPKSLASLVVLAGFVLLHSFPFVSRAHAGCGCDKPPPALAEVRPNVTYAGMPVTLFHASLQSGQSYDVTFTSGITGAFVGKKLSLSGATEVHYDTALRGE